MDKIISNIDIKNCPKLWKNVTKCYKTYGKYLKIQEKIVYFVMSFIGGLFECFLYTAPKTAGY